MLSKASKAKIVDVYTDGSSGRGGSVGAYFIDQNHFGAVILDNPNSFMGELAGLALALERTTGPLCVHSDHQGLGQLMHQPVTSRTFKKAAKRYEMLATVRAEFDTRGSLIQYCKGHGETTPLGMKFADRLSRAIRVRRSELGLHRGEVVGPEMFGWNQQVNVLKALQVSLSWHHQGKRLLTDVELPRLAAFEAGPAHLRNQLTVIVGSR